MNRERSIRFILENHGAFDSKTLELYPDEKLREIKETVKVHLLANGKSLCNVCNGNGTVLNIECEQCKGYGVTG